MYTTTKPMVFLEKVFYNITIKIIIEKERAGKNYADDIKMVRIQI